MAILQRFIKDRSAATAIEYGLIVTMIAVACIGGFSALGNSIAFLWASGSSKLVQALSLYP
jgi:pilus assembly protein Flp/PilA